jgi:TRAP transporter TAXI family solute receptor
MPEPSEADDPIDKVFAAYLRSCDEGHPGSREEFLAKFPEMADELRSLMEAADAIDRFTIAGAPLSGDFDSVDAGNDTPLYEAETVDFRVAGPNDSVDDPAETLPEANRAKDDPGPRLPFDLGDYELIEVIGRGGMGVVYRATQRMLDRTVAVKMIRGGMLACENDVRRFYTEAQSAAALHHPGIVPVYQFGQRAGHHFFSMALIEGTDLQRKINREPISIEDAARYVRDVALALDHAHRNGVLHRDIKPANILIDREDKVHITDFGLAKHVGSDSSVTGSGAAVGTPNYMAPEQAGGHSDRASHRSDVYSLGAILFAAVTGRPPLVGETIVETLMHVIHDPPPKMRTFRSGVPADLETIVAKCLEKNPKKRYPTAAALAEDLQAFLEGRPIKARPHHPVMKLWHWITGVPLVGALIGRKVVRGTPGHRRFQAAMLLILAVTPFFIVGGALIWNHYTEVMPEQVSFAGGIDRGMYNGVSASLAERISKRTGSEVSVVPSGGSMDNRRRLLEDRVDIAPLQASAISGDELCVIAPLFYEAAHLLARDHNGVISADQLAGHPIAIGPSGSGSRKTAEMILNSLKLSADETPRVIVGWDQLDQPDAPDVALVCVGRGSSLVADLLDSGWRLLPIPESISISLQHPTLRPLTISRGDYDTDQIPESGIPTVGTTAFLAARRDAPSELVQITLEALYEPPPLFVGLIPRERAAEWQGLDFHATARKYFSSLEQSE